jgi:hypothetical protein
MQMHTYIYTDTHIHLVTHWHLMHADTFLHIHMLTHAIITYSIFCMNPVYILGVIQIILTFVVLTA